MKRRRCERFVAAALVLASATHGHATAQTVGVPVRPCKTLIQGFAGDGPASPPGPALEQAFKSNAEALRIVGSIVAHVGVAANFAVAPGNTGGGALATVCYDTAARQLRRYIVYELRFMAEIRQRSATYWSLVGVLAHEIGHHLNGHAFQRGKEQAKELEADRFAGFVMARMGATLEEALSGVRIYGDPAATATHPQRRERLEAVTAGWQASRQGVRQSEPTGLVAAPRTSRRIIRAREPAASQP